MYNTQIKWLNTRVGLDDIRTIRFKSGQFSPDFYRRKTLRRISGNRFTCQQLTSVLTGNPASQWGSIAFIQQSCFYDTLCPSVGLNSEETVPLTENLIKYKMY